MSKWRAPKFNGYRRRSPAAPALVKAAPPKPINHQPTSEPLARQTGFDDAKFDGIDTFPMLDCQCEICAKAYGEGWEAGIEEALHPKGE